MLAAAGWRGTPSDGGALHDPCCGSGTIAIEAAQIACGIAPGRAAPLRLRAAAAVRRRRARAPNAAPASRSAARACARRAVPIFASDMSFRMVDFARRNAERAGVADAIDFHGGDALERPAPRLPAELPGTLMVNPPYGERIEVGGKAAGRRRDAASSDRDDAERLLRPPGGALEARLHRAPGRLDGLDPEPRHAPAERDAAEGIAPRADVERADRVPPVPLRPRRRLGARRAPRSRPRRPRPARPARRCAAYQSQRRADQQHSGTIEPRLSQVQPCVVTSAPELNEVNVMRR